MVYGGKPSRGCQTCKTRKIKCDEARPTCLQCKKSSRTCLGYKEEADLIFRNQNEKTAEKAQRPRKSRQRNDSSPTIESVNDATTLQIVRRDNGRSQPYLGAKDLSIILNGVGTPQAPPTLSIAEQVVHVYFTNFAVLYQNQDTVRGFLPYLVPMYGASSENSPLRQSCRAAALCAISQLPGQRQLARQAMLYYGKAIMAVAVSLQNPVAARSDETLQATLLLGLFESIKASNKSINAWSQHVDGAAAIVRARGTEQFNNPQSLSLFRATRTQMLINCIRQEQAPPDFPAEGGWLSDASVGGENISEFTSCALELPYLLAKAKSLYPSQRDAESLRAVSELVEKAYALQVKMTMIFSALDEKWQPRTIGYINEEPANIATAEAWIGPIHEYADVQVASVINKLRSCLMFSTWIVIEGIEWLAPDSYGEDGRWIQSRYVEQTTIDDICSSVPFHLHWDSEDKAKTPDQMETIADMIGGLSLVWPLGGAARSARAPKRQKAWMWGRLKKISQDCGLEQASLLEKNITVVLDSILNRS